MRRPLAAAAWAVLAAAGGAEPSAVVAAGSVPTGGQLAEIVVTATRREERGQDVAIAVTALSAATLEANGIDTVRDLMHLAPGLSIRPFLGDNTSATIAMRGMVMTDNLISIDPTVGMYLDGVYIARATGGNAGLLDVNRVEVLRGPQGTLFGRNTIGGAVSIVSNAPSSERFSGQVAAQGGNYGLVEAEGVVNAPLGMRAALRFAGSVTRHDGYARSSLTGTDLNDERSDYLRGQLRLDPTPALTITVGGDYWHTHSGGQWATLNGLRPFGSLYLENGLTNNSGPVSFGPGGVPVFTNPPPALVVDPLTDRPSSTVNAPGLNAEVSGVTLTVAWQAGPGTLKSITAQRQMFRDNQGNDLDGSPAPGIQQFQGYADQRQLSEELQYFGTAFDQRFDYIAGLYYFHEQGLDRSRVQFIPKVTDCLSPAVPAPLLFNCDGIPAVHQVTEGYAKNTSRSVFLQLGFRLGERFRLDLGARRVEDDRALSLNSRNVRPSAPLEARNTADIVSCVTAGALPSNLCEFVTPGGSFGYTPFMAGLEFRSADDALLYAKFSRGFRAGGINIRGSFSGALNPFGPERADTTEVGLKSEWLEHRLRLNAALYDTRYTGIQLTAIINTPAGTPSTTIFNAGEARVLGGELEAEWLIGRLSLAATGSWTDAIYTQLSSNVASTDVTLDSAFSNTPRSTLALMVDYTLPLGQHVLRLHAGYDWRALTYFANVPPRDGSNAQPAFGLFDARATLGFPRGFEVALWGQNLANQGYRLTTLDFYASLGFTAALPGDPRTFGLSLKKSF
jgi:iron complex outermembrane recepter protein